MWVRVNALLTFCAVVVSAYATAPPPPPRAPTVPPIAVDSPDDDDPIVDYSRKQDAPHTARTRLTTYRATFFNMHTHELMPAPRAATLQEEEVASFLRCRVTGHEKAVAGRVIDVALDMAERFESEQIQVISGFRSPKFNEMLRKKGRQVARNSHHTLGQALDFRIPGVPAELLAATVEEVHVGGIGTYRASDFVHVDIGRDRRWRGR